MLYVDFEKAFGSFHHETLWKILRSYGLPWKIVDIISMLYEVCGQHLTDSFGVQTGVKQGSIPFPFLFLLATEWLMRRTTADRKRGIQWALTSALVDLNFADDIGLLSSRQ